MSLLSKLSRILEKGRMDYLALKDKEYPFMLVEKIKQGNNMLAKGDNLLFMKYLMDYHDMAGRIKLIYIDPPFFSKANYGTEIKIQSKKLKTMPVMKQKAYKDIWEDGMEEYLQMLIPRLYLMKDLLADDGCIWVHLDWHGVHYVKLLLDEIFGEKNFINEVIWNYKSGGVSNRYFARKHDTLLFYAKSSDYYFKAQKEKSYNRKFKPYRFKGVEEYKDELGWYTMVNMKDVWQIDMVGRTSGERTGYATQKPELLLERILESCSKEGDLCADFFGGSGTLAAVADRMNRKWIYSDLGKLAAGNAHKRMVNKTQEGYDFYVEGVLSGEEAHEEGVFNIKVDVDSQGMLNIELVDYKPEDINNIPVEKKYLDNIREIIKDDSLQLIDYWAVDFYYDGKVFKPDQCFVRRNSQITSSCQKKVEEFISIGIKVMDIFGDTSFKLFQLEGGLQNEGENQ